MCTYVDTSGTEMTKEKGMELMIDMAKTYCANKVSPEDLHAERDRVVEAAGFRKSLKKKGDEVEGTEQATDNKEQTTYSKQQATDNRQQPK